MSVRRWMAVVGLVGLVGLVAGCGGGDSDSDGMADAAVPSDASADASAVETTSDSESSTNDTEDDTADATSEGTTTSTSPPTTTTTVPPLAVASAELIDAKVEYKTAADVEFAALTEPVDVAVGDTVRTDPTGFAVVAYFDGSLTRLDVDTEFEVLGLVDDVDASVVRTRMGLGRTWHRVQSLGEGSEFSVETSVATAVVQGTAFSVECVSQTECTFLVVDGSVLVVLADGTEVELVAPAAVTVDETGAGDVAAVPFDGAFGDDWLFDNTRRDTDTDPTFVSAAEIYQAHGSAFASSAGAYTATLVDAPASDCEPYCEFWKAWYGGPFEPKTRSFEFRSDCSAVPCTLGATIENADGSNTVTPTFDGTAISFTIEDSGGASTACTIDVESDGVSDYDSGVVSWSPLDYRLEVADASIIDDRWVATSLTGRIDERLTLDDVGECLDFDWLADFAFPAVGSTADFPADITAVRVG